MKNITRTKKERKNNAPYIQNITIAIMKTKINLYERIREHKMFVKKLSEIYNNICTRLTN